ncbi:MAG: YaaA family protein [Oscillospiraceae bacterium]|nr:YaaA family protein [Oscillospiraceae bacterium]
MLAILSPAKRMRVLPLPERVSSSRPVFEKDAVQLNEELKEYAPWQLESLMRINPELALETFDRIRQFGSAPETAALLAYEGLQYQHLRPETFSAAQWKTAGKRLRVLSGLYGLLRPTDLIHPYRLEMGCRPISPEGNLYRFWGSRLRDQLFAETDLLINLASAEYAKAVEPHLRSGDRMVTVDFLMRRRGKLQTPATWAKMARGEMAGWMVRQGVSCPEELREFCWEGFRYAPALSSSRRLCFFWEADAL